MKLCLEPKLVAVSYTKHKIHWLNYHNQLDHPTSQFFFSFEELLAHHSLQILIFTLGQTNTLKLQKPTNYSEIKEQNNPCENLPFFLCDCQDAQKFLKFDIFLVQGKTQASEIQNLPILLRSNTRCLSGPDFITIFSISTQRVSRGSLASRTSKMTFDASMTLTNSLQKALSELSKNM